MIDWLRIISMVFYAPLRGMREARDRSSLAPMALIAFISQVAFTLITKKFAGTANLTSAGSVASELFRSSMTVVMVAIIIVPLLTLVANMFDRRGSFRVVITQEYAPVAATMFYALMAVNIAAIVIAVFFHYSGIQAIYVASTMRQADQIRAMLNGSPQWNAVVEQLLADPGAISENFFRVPK